MFTRERAGSADQKSCCALYLEPESIVPTCKFRCLFRELPSGGSANGIHFSLPPGGGLTNGNHFALPPGGGLTNGNPFSLPPPGGLTNGNHFMELPGGGLTNGTYFMELPPDSWENTVRFFVPLPIIGHKLRVCFGAQ